MLRVWLWRPSNAVSILLDKPRLGGRTSQISTCRGGFEAAGAHTENLRTSYVSMSLVHFVTVSVYYFPLSGGSG